MYPSLHFLIYNINLTSSPTLTYSNIFLFTNCSFHLLIYNINVTFSSTITYFNLFHFTTAPFHFLVYNLNITFPPTLTYSSSFLFTVSCFTPLWYVINKFWIGGVTCLGCLIHKTCFFWEGLDVPSFIYFLAFFFSVQFFNFRCTFLPWLIFYYRTHQKTSFTLT